jgi:hypothetical protein
MHLLIMGVHAAQIYSLIFAHLDVSARITIACEIQYLAVSNVLESVSEERNRAKSKLILPISARSCTRVISRMTSMVL